MQPAPLAGTATHKRQLRSHFSLKMQPAPLAGTATLLLVDFTSIPLVATRTPRGDGNN